MDRMAKAGKPGRPQTPAYERSKAEAKLFCAVLEARAVRKERAIPLAQAARLVAPLHGVSVNALLGELAGKPTGGTRRIRARLKNK